MTNSVYKSILIFLLILAVPVTVTAAELPFKYTNENIWTSVHDKPLHFERDEMGNFLGITEAGRTFTQNYVATTISVRLQKFSIDEAYYYVSSIGIINATSDIEALSIYLS